MNDDTRLAARLAEEAGAVLLAIQRGGGPAMGAEGDRVANALLMKALRAARPNDAILSEEEPDDGARCAVRRVWVIDPLDGTREFAAGSDDWAVHVGLAIDGVPAVGAVALPAWGETLSSGSPPALGPAASPPRIVVSRTRCPHEAERAAVALGAVLLPMGSAGAKAMAVVRGRAEAYVHAGGQYEWDNCAPAAVAIAAGLHVSRLDGSPLVYNCADPYLPDLLMCRPELARAILAAM